MKSISNAVIAAAAFLSMPAAATAQSVVVEANGARAHGRWGGELGLGYRIGMGGFALTPAIGVFLHEGDNDRFERQTFSNGQSRCRDLSNGQFASDSECVNIAAKAYGRVEATYAIPAFAEVGGGVRLSKDKASPYGTIALPLGPSLRLKGNAGDRYYALGLTARF